jgi:hypothetical protein
MINVSVCDLDRAEQVGSSKYVKMAVVRSTWLSSIKFHAAEKVAFFPGSIVKRFFNES